MLNIEGDLPVVSVLSDQGVQRVCIWHPSYQTCISEKQCQHSTNTNRFSHYWWEINLMISVSSYIERSVSFMQMLLIAIYHSIAQHLCERPDRDEAYLDSSLLSRQLWVKTPISQDWLIYFYSNLKMTVEKFGCSALPEFGERGITAYLAIDRSLSAVLRSFDSIALINPNSCITLSSCLRSSWPFRRNMYSAPSDPWIVSFLGRCLLVITVSCFANAAIVTTGAPAR